jgi:cbb3-type cytochrome oxidase maturation protein
MGIVFVLLPISLALAAIALCAYFWGVRNGQFDDLETPALRILFDDEQEPVKPVNKEEPK